MTKIKFGTDGWRAIIAKEFTVDNVVRISEATGNWTKKNIQHPSIVLGMIADLRVKCLLKPQLKYLLLKA